MQFWPVIALLAIVVVVGLLLILRSRKPTQDVADRLNDLVASGQSFTLEDLELSQPFSQRVLVPMVEKLSKIAQRFTPSNTIEETRHKLELAGIGHKLKPAQFLGIRVMAALVLGLLSLLIAFAGAIPIAQRLLIIIVAFVLGYLFPGIWLGSKIKRRQTDVLKSLPDAMDLLTICVEAGLDFGSSMQRVAEKWDNELSKAFLRTVQEMQLGKLRREAMRNMASSMDVSDVTSFVAAIVQADLLGVSMAKVMRIQSETMRMKRRQRAEEKARQAPVKMMLPLVFFVFPVILIVLLGPAIIQIKNTDLSGI